MPIGVFSSSINNRNCVLAECRRAFSSVGRLLSGVCTEKQPAFISFEELKTQSSENEVSD